MFKNLLEYREMQQLRKDHLNQQKRRHAMILFGALMGLLLVMLAIQSVTAKQPLKPAQAATQVATPDKPQTTTGLSASARIQHDAEWSGKQAKYCLNVGQQAGLQEPELSQQYERCIDHTAKWPMGKFE